MGGAYRSAVATCVVWLACCVPSPAVAQAVDYHKAQQAGKVWERKMELGRNGQRDRTNSQGVPYDAPLTEADLAITRRNNPGSYEELVRSVGTKNADRWLEMKARIDRSKR